MFFSLTLFANTSSCQLDVYFGNGVYNDERAANDSKIKLKKFIQVNYPLRFSQADNGVTYSFKYAHNASYGVINDLIETHWQLYESGQISELYFSFVASALDGIDNTNSDKESFRERIRNIIAQYNIDITSMLNLYRNGSFNNQHNVLLVAHSQGNLFGNKMYDLLSVEEKQKFQMVSVATPADSVAGGGGYTTLHSDWVIKAIPNSLDSNADGSGHSFVESYLYNPIYTSVEALSHNINNAVNILDENSCKKYVYFNVLGYICPSRQDTELSIDIYGKENIDSNGWMEQELVVTESIERVEKVLNVELYERTGRKEYNCPIEPTNDFYFSHSIYDKNGCSGYVLDGTSPGYNLSIDDIASKTYTTHYACTTYQMNPSIVEVLKKAEK